MAVSKTLLSRRGHSRQREGKRRARAHPEPMDTEGVSFGARLIAIRSPQSQRRSRWSMVACRRGGRSNARPMPRAFKVRTAAAYRRAAT